MRAQMTGQMSFGDPYSGSKRFREDDMGPKEILPQHNNHYDQKMPRFQGNVLGGTPMTNIAAAGIELVALGTYNVTSKHSMPSRRKTWMRKAQNNIFHALEKPRTRWAYLYHGFVFMLILASLSLSVVITNKSYAKVKSILDSVYYLEVSLVFVFTLEYILRIWSCSCHGCYKGIWGKMKFIKKPYMVIDIIVIVATTAVITTTKKEESKADYFSVSLLRFLRFLQVLRVLRIDRQQGAFKMVSNVLYDHRQELLTCCYMTFILIIACSFLVYLAEQSDETFADNEMRDLGDGIYWGFITLSTIGYGDIFPQNTVAKWITVIFSFVGTAFFALPAGILGSGFALQVAANQKQKHNNKRRAAAAVLIQYSWRTYAVHPYNHYVGTWKHHQARVSSKDRYSIYGGNDQPTITGGGKSFAYLRRKFNSGRQSAYMEGDGYSRSRRSSIGATIPSALELRDRCQSEGNLLLVSPNHVEDNQATIVSLPQSISVLTDFAGMGGDKGPGLYSSHQDVYVKPLTEAEKNCIRFIRKIKFGIAIRKYREQLQPYDIKDVVEQYTVGQMEMYSFIKKCQTRVEATLGVKDVPVDMNNCLNTRILKVESKMETLDEKLDMILQILAKDISPNQVDEALENKSRQGNEFNMDSGDQPVAMNESFRQKMQRKKGMSTEQMDELNRRLELLKDDSEYSSLSCSETTLQYQERRGSRFSVRPTLTSDDYDHNAIPDIKEQSQNSSLHSVNPKNNHVDKVDCASLSGQRTSNSVADLGRFSTNASPVPFNKCKHESMNSINSKGGGSGFSTNSHPSPLTLNRCKHESLSGINRPKSVDSAKKCSSVPSLSDRSINHKFDTKNHFKNLLSCKRNSNGSLRGRDFSTPPLRRLFSPDACNDSELAHVGKTMSVDDLIGRNGMRSTDFITPIVNGHNGVFLDKCDVPSLERQSEIGC